MSQKFRDGHSLKRCVLELLAGVIFNVYDQHTQIITELVAKLNKWHITIEKLYRKPTKTEQFKKTNYDSTVGSNREPKTPQARPIALRQKATRCKCCSKL